MAKDIKMKDLIKESFGSTAFSTVGGLVTQKPINSISVPSMSDLVEGEENLLNANVSFLNSKRDFLLNYFELKSLDGSLIKLFDEYLPSIN